MNSLEDKQIGGKPSQDISGEHEIHVFQDFDPNDGVRDE
jgi:hypothetical protein